MILDSGLLFWATRYIRLALTFGWSRRKRDQWGFDLKLSVMNFSVNVSRRRPSPITIPFVFTARTLDDRREASVNIDCHVFTPSGRYTHFTTAADAALSTRLFQYSNSCFLYSIMQCLQYLT